MSPLRSAVRALGARLAAVAALLLVALLASVGAASPASADTTLQDAVTALRNGESVYVAADADPTMTGAQARDLRQRITNIGYPFFVAVLPQAAAVNSSSTDTLKALKDGVGMSGTYALYIGDSFRAGDTTTSVAGIATVAYRDHKADGVYAVLDAFVAGAGQKLAGTSGDSANLPLIGGVLVAGAAVVGGGSWLVYRRRKQANAERTEAVQRTVFEDVTSYGEDVAHIDVRDPRLDDAGRADAQRALDAYEVAKDKVTSMQRPEDAATVTAALEDGRYSLACVEARLDGRPVPERRPPCFVDPRHGPSVRDVTWAPDGGVARPIPVCAACATTLESGQLPQARTVEMAGGRVPYWAAGRAYGPYAGGYYANSGMDLMSGIFIGSMLGGMYSGPTYIDNGGGIADSGGGWGGGDFGGGDFGGGDFGGGDFGGGDFGGGGDF
jgi:hypothetical protein